jgi:hypothetical protein
LSGGGWGHSGGLPPPPVTVDLLVALGRAERAALARAAEAYGSYIGLPVGLNGS